MRNILNNRGYRARVEFDAEDGLFFGRIAGIRDNDDFIVAATVKRFGKASAYVDCSVTFASSGELVAHSVLEFAF